MEALFFVIAIFYLALIALMVVSMWKIFEKAGRPGWAAIVPIYNMYTYTQIINRPGWWIVLYLVAVIPILGSLVILVIAIVDSIRLAKVFGKSGGFAAGLILLSIVFYPILAFGDAQYQGSSTSVSGDLLDQ